MNIIGKSYTKQRSGNNLARKNRINATRLTPVVRDVASAIAALAGPAFFFDDIGTAAESKW